MKLAITDQLGRSLGRRGRHPGLPFHENTEGLEAFTGSLTVGGHESKSSRLDGGLKNKKKAKEKQKPVIHIFSACYRNRRCLMDDRTELTDRSI